MLQRNSRGQALTSNMIGHMLEKLSADPDAISSDAVDLWGRPAY